jgi:dolichyl-phosphate beta-glucosyltransferase
MAPWLVLSCYLLGAVAVTWQLWAGPASRAQVGDSEDVDQFAWFVRYSATAIAHGHLPALVTTAMNAPRGINMMWNTTFLFPGTVLSPVTLLAGPQVTLTIVLTLGFAGSAASLFWVLRRWGASITAAALGGALYGFSPALLDAGIGHYNFQFAVAPPLIIDALLRIVTGRGNAVRTGVWLGLLIAAQLFTGEELLADTALAGLVIVVVLAASQIVVVLAASHPGAVRERARDVAFGLGVSVAVVLLICGHALWVQLRGPLSQHGSWETLGTFTNHLSGFVAPPGSLLFHTRASPTTASTGAGYLPEYLAYLGWPLIVVLAAAAIRYWRDPKVRAAAVTCAVLELFSLGGVDRKFLGFRYPGAFLPWHWLQSLPVVGAILPDRFSILADGAAAAVLAFALDLARSAAPEASDWRRRSLPLAVAVLALLPLVPLPMRTDTVTQVPVGWQAAFARLRLPASAPVLVVPVPYSHRPEPLRWQADTGEPGSLNGGWFVGSDQTGQAVIQYFGPPSITAFILYLDALWAGSSPAVTPSSQEIRADLAYLRPAAVVAVTRGGSPLAQRLTELFGRPTFEVGQVLAWRR